MRLSLKAARPHIQKKYAPGGGFSITAPIIENLSGRKTEKACTVQIGPEQMVFLKPGAEAIFSQSAKSLKARDAAYFLRT